MFGLYYSFVILLFFRMFQNDYSNNFLHQFRPIRDAEVNRGTRIQFFSKKGGDRLFIVIFSSFRPWHFRRRASLGVPWNAYDEPLRRGNAISQNNRETLLTDVTWRRPFGFIRVSNANAGAERRFRDHERLFSKKMAHRRNSTKNVRKTYRTRR